jgi:hypothetical protein
MSPEAKERLDAYAIDNGMFMLDIEWFIRNGRTIESVGWLMNTQCGTDGVVIMLTLDGGHGERLYAVKRY